MSGVKWSEVFSVGITEMDKQHKYLLGIVNQFSEAMQSKSHELIIRELLPGLLSAAQKHFEDEEQIMREVEYPEIGPHRVLHLYLVEQLGNMTTRLQEGKVVPIYSFVPFLEEWLIQHVQQEDKRLGDYIRSLPQAETASKVTEGAGLTTHDMPVIS